MKKLTLFIAIVSMCFFSVACGIAPISVDSSASDLSGMQKKYAMTDAGPALRPTASTGDFNYRPLAHDTDLNTSSSTDVIIECHQADIPEGDFEKKVCL